MSCQQVVDMSRRGGTHDQQQTAIVAGSADRFGALVVTKGKEFVKKHPAISVTWFVGLLVSVLASGFTSTPEAVQNYEVNETCPDSTVGIFPLLLLFKLGECCLSFASALGTKTDADCRDGIAVQTIVVILVRLLRHSHLLQVPRTPTIMFLYKLFPEPSLVWYSYLSHYFLPFVCLFLSCSWSSPVDFARE